MFHASEHDRTSSPQQIFDGIAGPVDGSTPGRFGSRQSSAWGICFRARMSAATMDSPCAKACSRLVGLPPQNARAPLPHPGYARSRICVERWLVIRRAQGTSPLHGWPAPRDNNCVQLPSCQFRKEGELESTNMSAPASAASEQRRWSKATSDGTMLRVVRTRLVSCGAVPRGRLRRYDLAHTPGKRRSHDTTASPPAS